MNDGRLHIGIIGAGEIAMQTARAVHASPVTEIAGVMDVRPDMARDLASTYDVPWTDDAAHLLARPEVDAVYIAVPHFLHAPLAVEAAAAGKHVLCEKPIATTLEDADRMIAACREAGVVLDVCYDAQTAPGLRVVRGMIAEGAVGTIIGAHMAQLIDKPATYWSSGWSGRVTTDWRLSREKSGGGVLLMNGSYDINTVRYLTGLEAVRVYAEYGTFDQPVEVEEYLAATIRYAGGAVGSIEMSSCVRGAEEVRGPSVRIFGTAGQIALADRPRIFVVEPFRDYIPGQWQDIGVEFVRYAKGPIVEGFARTVLQGGPPPVSGEDARAVLEIVLAAYRSGEEGRPVFLKPPAAELISG